MGGGLVQARMLRFVKMLSLLMADQLRTIVLSSVAAYVEFWMRYMAPSDDATSQDAELSETVRSIFWACPPSAGQNILFEDDQGIVANFRVAYLKRRQKTPTF
jgi:hypothetical protein